MTSPSQGEDPRFKSGWAHLKFLKKKTFISLETNINKGEFMYDRCESCGKLIVSAEDCRLQLGNDGVVHTYCLECSSKHIGKP